MIKEKLKPPSDDESSEGLNNYNISSIVDIPFDISTIPGCYQSYDSDSVTCVNCYLHLQCARQTIRGN